MAPTLKSGKSVTYIYSYRTVPGNLQVPGTENFVRQESTQLVASGAAGFNDRYAQGLGSGDPLQGGALQKVSGKIQSNMAPLCCLNYNQQLASLR